MLKSDKTNYLGLRACVEVWNHFTSDSKEIKNIK